MGTDAHNCIRTEKKIPTVRRNRKQDADCFQWMLDVFVCNLGNMISIKSAFLNFENKADDYHRPSEGRKS